MSHEFSSLKVIDVFFTPPDSAGMAQTFGNIGYDLSEALAELIDNSVDASASNVLITFFRDDNTISSITIADDGRGMDKSEMKKAMQFCVAMPHKDSDLGRFGVGMKAASLDQCDTMTVISRRDGPIAACRWSAETVGANWKCELIDPVSAKEAFGKAFSGPAPNAGTVVIWDRLKRLSPGTGEGALDVFLLKKVQRLIVDLGLTFHRFIEGGRLHISIRTVHETRNISFPHEVPSLDPFPQRDAAPDYPKIFTADLPGFGKTQLEAHIWPPDSADPGFLLGKRTATARQGFYFYRNQRLIQAGGWNDVLPDATERDLSLARVKIDLPCDTVTTNPQKTKVQISATASHALKRAKSGGTRLDDYLQDARNVYCDSKPRKRRFHAAPVIMGYGVPAALRQRVRKLMGGNGVTRQIDFAWEPLGEEQFFELDTENDRIILNKDLRHAILDGTSASGADAPVLKSLLFLLFHKEFDRQRSSAKSSEWQELCNDVLRKAVRKA